MREIVCRAATVARFLRVLQTPGFIVRDHILMGPSADSDFPEAVEGVTRDHTKLQAARASGGTVEKICSVPSPYPRTDDIGRGKPRL